MVCFSLFVPFASFAVHDSKTECPLYFRRENHREILENCESLYGLFLLVRAVRVVRGSWNSKGVSTIDSNRERRENRESLYGLLLLVRTLRVVRGS